jgi:hypothetical protein
MLRRSAPTAHSTRFFAALAARPAGDLRFKTPHLYKPLKMLCFF